MKKTKEWHSFVLGALSVAALPLLPACTQQKPNSFRLQQQLEEFPAAREINTRIDLLWVVDNSASMDVSQDKLRRGFGAFARKYLRPTWDIRVAVITSDTFMANPAFSGYLNSTIEGTERWSSPYINTRLNTWVNPQWNSNLLNLNTGVFNKGIRWNDQVPAWGPDYARLIPGQHDGPIAALCSEQHSYFFNGTAQCKIRDDQTRNTGPEHCLTPAVGESAVTQCVNTVQNDTIHSGHPILSTRQSDTEQLVRDFYLNASVGTSGSGSERGLGSLLQFLTDNEKTETAFFRPDSQRVIVFLSDEEDQSLRIPAAPSSGFTPFTGYSNNCGIKFVDDYEYRISSCPDPLQLIPVTEVRQKLDKFFTDLDGSLETPHPYLVIPIVPLTGESLRKLQALRAPGDAAAGNSGNVAVDRGERYLELAASTENGSFAMDIAEEDYSTLLDRIGRAMIQRKSDFRLSRAPTSTEDMVVTILHADGTETPVSADQYTLSGTILTLTQLEFVLSLSSTDRILINYQPKNVL